MISLSNIVKSYQGQVVLDIPELELPENKLTALVGPNGAGKSTLFAVASRLLDPDRSPETGSPGTVLVDGKNIHTGRKDDIRKLLAVLRQEHQLQARITVVELVRFGRFPHSKGRWTAEDHQIVAEALEFAELQDLRDRYLDQLSGGQRQRAFVAMVLAQQTKYVLLDEPLNNLDIRHSVQMMRRLRSLVDERGRSVALVLHDINFASAHADHVVAMRAGKVIAAGPPEEIIRPEVLREVYDVDVRVLDDRGTPIAVYFS